VNHARVCILALVWVFNVSSGWAAVLYLNDFDGPLGSEYAEWTSSPINFVSATNPPGTGVVPAQRLTNCDSTNGLRRFLGEFGGPRIGTPSDPGYNWTRVEQTITLTLTNLPPHSALKVSFDLLILKSWDGNSPRYGADRWSLSVAGGDTLLATTFSNNHKVATQGSNQDYPRTGSPPWSGVGATNTLGYQFFGDSTYPLEFTFAHDAGQLTLNFSSSLFEGKGTADESWALDNVRITSASAPSKE